MGQQNDVVYCYCLRRPHLNPSLHFPVERSMKHALEIVTAPLNGTPGESSRMVITTHVAKHYRLAHSLPADGRGMNSYARQFNGVEQTNSTIIEKLLFVARHFGTKAGLR
jgi:hypothetical protein